MCLEAEHLERLESRLDYRFRDPSLAQTALTHRSLAHEQQGDDHYERLEFLGDAVLGMVAAEWLYRRYPDRPEGDLSRLKSHLVSAPVLARYADCLELGDLLLLGLGEERSGGRQKPSLLADSLEALFGAVYLDGGLVAVTPVIETFLLASESRGEKAFGQDAKTKLQELLQSRGWPLPRYRLVNEAGPDHSKTFTVECWVREQVAGSGSGASKKLAEQRAAAVALTVAESLDQGEGAP